MYCDAPPTVKVKAKPSKANAKKALDKLRAAFRTFPFAKLIWSGARTG